MPARLKPLTLFLLMLLLFPLTIHARYGGPPPAIIAWSPDGQRIAFAGSPAGAGIDKHIYVVNADGSDLRQLTQVIDTDYRFEWSPDSRTLYSGGFSEPDVSVLIDVESGEIMPLVTDEGLYVGAVRFSADGRRAAYAVMNSEEQHSLRVLDLDSGADTALDIPQLGSYQQIVDFQWRPNRDQIGVMITGPEGFIMQVLNTTTGGNETGRAQPWYCCDVVWSASGDLLLHPTIGLYDPDTAEWIDVKTSLDTDRVDIHGLSADEQQLLVHKNMGSGSEIGILELESQVFTSLVTLPDPVSGYPNAPTLLWSPNGHWVLGEIAGESVLIDVVEYTVEPLDFRIERAVWSPDGMQVAVLESQQLLIYDLEQGQQYELMARPLEHVAAANWSPDSQMIALNEHGDRFSVYAVGEASAEPFWVYQMPAGT